METKKIISSVETIDIFNAVWQKIYHVVFSDQRELWLKIQSVEDKFLLVEKPEPEEIKERHPHFLWDDFGSYKASLLFNFLFPEGTKEEEMNFIQGKHEMLSVFQSNLEWMENVIKERQFSPSEARCLVGAIGRWDSARFVRSVCHWVGTGYKTYYYRLSAGGKTYEAWFRVTGPDTFMWGYSEVNLAAEKAAKRTYYSKVKSLADEAGVPWKIASLLKDKDGDRQKNVAALAEARQIHFSKLDRETIHELQCGIDRRLAAISDLLMRSERFDLNGQIKSRRLAYYLVGNH